MRLRHWFVFLGLAAGCGKVSDDSKLDAAVDANLNDADERGMATIVTENDLFGGTTGSPAGGVDVFSNLPNGQLLESGTTDPSGHTTLAVYPGGSVTAMYRHTVDGGAELITWLGVQPNDTLKFGSRNPDTSNGNSVLVGTQTYTWPAFAGATSYYAFTACGEAFGGAGTTAASLTESSDCHKDPMDVLFIAYGSGIIGYSYRTNVPFADGGVVSISSWSNPQTATVNISGLAPEFTNVSGDWGAVLDNTTNLDVFGGFNGTPTGGAYTGTFPYYPSGDRTVGTVTFNRPSYSAVRVIDAFSASTLSETIAAPELPPLQQSGVIVSSGLRMANWFFVPQSGSRASGTVLRLTWNRTANSMTSFYRWYFIMPPMQLAVSFPKLPASLDMFAPQPMDPMSGQVRAFNSPSLSNYDAVRAQPSQNIMCLECAVNGGDIQRVIYSGGSVN